MPIGRSKKAVGLMKDELGGKIVTEFVALRANTYSCLRDDDNKTNKAKATKKCVTERELNFQDYKNWLLNNKVMLKSQQRFKSEAHSVHTEEVNKTALSSNDDKTLQALGKYAKQRY